jgi:hypothetical protein
MPPTSLIGSRADCAGVASARQKSPIVMLDGMILDGCNRRRACLVTACRCDPSLVERRWCALMSIMRGPKGAERLIIQTPGGLITREVPLRGDLGKDIQLATTSAKEIVASAKDLTSTPARNLSTARGPSAANEPTPHRARP